MSRAFDARVGAWVRAWKQLEAADKVLRKYPGLKDTEVHSQYQALIDQARIHADLAGAPGRVGEPAGEWLMDEEERLAQDEERFNMMFHTMFEKGKSDG